MTYRVTKTWGHDLGLSCAFRQRKAESHCRFLHGYAIAVEATFESNDLDECNWVIDFGSLDTIKTYLKTTFDHKTIVSKHDPYRKKFEELEELGLIQITWVIETGCESFAQMIAIAIMGWLSIHFPRIKLHSVTVKEHGANAATWIAS